MKFENTQVFNFEGAFRGLRNPMNSWDKSDSHYCYFDDDIDCPNCPLGGQHKNACNIMMGDHGSYIIGSNDMNLAQRMIKAGNPNDKFLRQIFISVDITAPRYWWSEFDTYKVGTVSNSCSTMHKLSAYPITLDMFDIDPNLDDFDEEYWYYAIKYLESTRQKYNKTKEINDFRKLKQALPESFKQKRTITMNYENIRNMIRTRSHHRLKEWSTDFINWCHNLPYSEELLFYCNGDDKNS